MSEKDYNPNMHTLEHILNGTVSKILGCARAFSTHIEKKKSKIDYRFDRSLTAQELDEIVSSVNSIIEQNIEVTQEFISVDKAKEMFDLSRLPQDVEGDLRIIKVGEFDSCPCIGSHVANTSEIGGLLNIISADHTPETGTLRIRFKIAK